MREIQVTCFDSVGEAAGADLECSAAALAQRGSHGVESIARHRDTPLPHRASRRQPPMPASAHLDDQQETRKARNRLLNT